MGGRKRRCSVCGCWFYPDPRVRHSQKTCGNEACRVVHRQRTQKRWRKTNPDYWVARRIAEKIAAVESASDGEPNPGAVIARPPPAEMARIPWDVVQDAFGAQQAVILSFFVRVACQAAQDAISRKLPEITADFGRLAGGLSQDAMERPVAPGQARRGPGPES